MILLVKTKNRYDFFKLALLAKFGKNLDFQPSTSTLLPPPKKLMHQCKHLIKCLPPLEYSLSPPPPPSNKKEWNDHSKAAYSLRTLKEVTKKMYFGALLLLVSNNKKGKHRSSRSWVQNLILVTSFLQISIGVPWFSFRVSEEVTKKRTLWFILLI